MTPEAPGTLRAVAVGAAIGVVLAFAGVAGALFASGSGSATALGVGGVAAFWGGLGFGSMLGGTLHLVRYTEREERPRPGRTEARAAATGPVALGPAAGSGARWTAPLAPPTERSHA